MLVVSGACLAGKRRQRQRQQQHDDESMMRQPQKVMGGVYRGACKAFEETIAIYYDIPTPNNQQHNNAKQQIKKRNQNPISKG